MDNNSEKLRRSFLALVEIDEEEGDAETGGWVTLDSISLDGALGEGDAELLAMRAALKKIASRFPEILGLDGSWVQVVVGSRVDGESVPAAVVMFGDTEEVPLVGIMSIAAVEEKVQASFLSQTMLEHEPRARAGFIAGVLDLPLRYAGNLAVAAYDVGQGNCNAIVDSYGHPRVFFDLGWAPNFHAATRPAAKPALFSCDGHALAPVILSHWDMDHWSYAIAASSYNPSSLTTRHTWNEDALRRFWIARPPQGQKHQLGPLTLSFYRALSTRQLLPGFGSLLLWPDGVKRIGFSDGWVEACKAAPQVKDDRNNNGLAVFVRPAGRGPVVALTGDADFPAIPSFSQRRKLSLAGMVAPHHGSRVTASHVPSPKRGGPGRLVMSVGKGNSYGHPKQQAIDVYQGLGWSAVATQDRFKCEDPSVPHDHVHGNLLLTFSQEQHNPVCGCTCVPDGKLCLVPIDVEPTAVTPGTRRRKMRAEKGPKQPRKKTRKRRLNAIAIS